jgi:hypothetical protein
MLGSRRDDVEAVAFADETDEDEADDEEAAMLMLGRPILIPSSGPRAQPAWVHEHGLDVEGGVCVIDFHIL